ncbi:RNA-binding protein 48 [Danaus plexippus]|uniref:RNA-binding protein 48 n=1 Tax=Danaus plexippus TaxID=13037 RepID=UPI002AB00B93|nr:RNA-binding protein 48 [Danaus plexippus]
MEESMKANLLPHHEQQSLCTTRLPYRQGRKLTAVKVYSITKESNHLLIFGVPSLNLRQETKSLFIKFGKLLKFNITEHNAEPFTETYHAQYEKIQSARVAKRMLDTKNFYGGVLHVCYAPELENVDETKQKLIQRQRDVIFRLRNLQRDTEKQSVEQLATNMNTMASQEKELPKKLDMGKINVIKLNDTIGTHRRWKRRKINHAQEIKTSSEQNTKESDANDSTKDYSCENGISLQAPSDIEIVDCTSVDSAIVTNINEHLNYNKFGNEVIRKVPMKPENKIQFYINKKS